MVMIPPPSVIKKLQKLKDVNITSIADNDVLRYDSATNKFINVNIPNPLVFKGSITVNSDFPTSASVQTGWMYKVTANVTDDDVTKTNTGQSFLAGEEIAWNGIDWTELGSTALWTSSAGVITPVNADDIYISKTDPELRLINTSGEYSRVQKLDVDNQTIRYNQVLVQNEVDANTLLLLHCDGTNGAQVFTDSSPSGRTVTAGGNTNTSTTWKKFGTASAYFDAVNDNLTVDASADFNLGNGNFTLEAWVRPSSIVGNEVIMQDRYYTVGQNGNWMFRLSPTALNFITFDGQGNLEQVSKAFTFVDDTEYHVAVVREGTGADETTLYVNGTSIGTGTISKDIGAATSQIILGEGTGTADFHGYMDEVRISDNARWTANFTAPTVQYGAPTTEEIQVWESKDSAVINEKGIQTFGDEDGQTIITGDNIIIDISGSTVVTVDSSGDWDFDDNNLVTTGTFGSGAITTTGNLEISKEDPEIRLTDNGNSEYGRILRADTDNEINFYNRVINPLTSDTKVLLHFDGNFDDSSASPHTFTAYNSCVTTSDQFKFGTESVYFNGTDMYIDTPDHADFNLADNNFTIECWVRRGRVHPTHTKDEYIAGQSNDTATSVSFLAWFECTTAPFNLFYFQLNYDGGNVRVFSSTVFNSTTEWNHIAVVRDGDNLNLYVNGALEDTGDVTGITALDSTGSLALGRLGDLTSVNFKFQGYIDEFRFTNGTALYTDEFEVPTLPYGLTREVNGITVKDTTPVNYNGEVIIGEEGMIAAVDSSRFEIRNDGTVNTRFYYNGYLGIGDNTESIYSFDVASSGAQTCRVKSVDSNAAFRIDRYATDDTCDYQFFTDGVQKIYLGLKQDLTDNFRIAYATSTIDYTGTDVILIDQSNGNVSFPADNQLVRFGAGDDCSITYDGTNMIINPKLVGSGYLQIDGDLNVEGNGHVILSGVTPEIRFIDTSETLGASIENNNNNLIFRADNPTGTEIMRLELDNVRLGINTISPSTTLHVNGEILVTDKILFTQTDGNEYIDSLADGYLDLGATTEVRINGPATRVVGDLYVGNNADVDPVIVFDGATNDGQITYMEDEDEFNLSCPIKATGYKSSDGSAGVSGTFIDNDGNTITVKDGLITDLGA